MSITCLRAWEVKRQWVGVDAWKLFFFNDKKENEEKGNENEERYETEWGSENERGREALLSWFGQPRGQGFDECMGGEGDKKDMAM